MPVIPGGEETLRRATSLAPALTDAGDAAVLAQLQQATARLETLARAGELLATTLDTDDVVRDVGALLVPDWADVAEMALVDGDVVRRIVVMATPHRDAVERREARRIRLTDEHPATRVIATGRPIVAVLGEGDDDWAFGPADDPTTARAFGVRSAVLVPLVARSGPIGALALGRMDDRRYTTDEVQFLAELARRAGLALDNARLYGMQRDLALNLQLHLLPNALPPVDGLHLAGRYVPAAGAAEVGGDWYDVLPLGSDRVVLVIGDTMGHGLDAATAMAQLRTMVRSYAYEGHGPAAVLHRTDRVAQAVGLPLATCLIVSLDLATGQATMASAGHLPPLLLGPDGTSAFVPVDPAPPLGIGALPTPYRCPVRPGSGLLLTTDGLVEDDVNPLTAGMARMALAVSRVMATFAGTEASADALADAALSTADPRRRDDVALLVAVRPAC